MAFDLIDGMEELIAGVSEVKDQIASVSAACEAIALNTATEAGAIKSYMAIRNLIRTGQIKKYLSLGDQIRVAKESGISVTVVGTITAATVSEETFMERVHTAVTAAYEFDYDGAAWHLNGESVELSTYGITVTGTPANNDKIVVHVQASTIIFDLVAFDYDVPENEELVHSVSWMTHDVATYGSIPYCAPQALKAITAEEFPNGLTAGQSYYITLDHGAYGGGTGEDGSYYFTPTRDVPVGGKIRHSSMGSWSASGYSKSRVLGGTFVTYDANYNQIETLATHEGATGTSLGKTTANTPSYLSGSHINFTERNIYGSNNAMHAAQKKWRESDAKGAASGDIASWWSASDEFDMPVRSTLPGFLHGIDPDFLAICVPVRKRTANSVAEGYGYVDSIQTVWCPSMTEMGFGNNNNVVETSVKADGTVNKTTALDLYVGANNEDRIKKSGNSAVYWFMRSPYPSDANHVRSVAPAGSLSYYNASIANGGVCGLTSA